MRTRFREDGPDAVWHITSRVNWQVWHLAPPNAHEVFLRFVREALDRFSVDLIAYVALSNHFHFVARCPPPEVFCRLTGRRNRYRHFRPWPRKHPKHTVIGQCLRHLKLQTAKKLHKELELTGHFWQGRHDRRRLDDLSDLVIATAYDHRNPVRAGMVNRPEQYPRSSAAWWAEVGSCPVPICTRSDFPFGAHIDDFRRELLQWQNDKRLDDVMAVFAKARLAIDSPKGRLHLRKLMDAAGIPAVVRQR